MNGIRVVVNKPEVASHVVLLSDQLVTLGELDTFEEVRQILIHFDVF